MARPIKKRNRFSWERELAQLRRVQTAIAMDDTLDPKLAADVVEVLASTIVRMAALVASMP
jgi:hypothetical protein